MFGKDYKQARRYARILEQEALYKAASGNKFFNKDRIHFILGETLSESRINRFLVWLSLKEWVNRPTDELTFFNNVSTFEIHTE